MADVPLGRKPTVMIAICGALVCYDVLTVQQIAEECRGEFASRPSLGNSIAELCRRGYIRRVAPATYQITRAGERYLARRGGEVFDV